MKKVSFTQLVLGISIIALGTGFLLDTTGAINFGQFAREWWPALVILVGITALIQNIRTPLWPAFIVIVGSLFLLNSLGILQFNVWTTLWPLVVILIGLSLIIRQPNRKQQVVDSKDRLDITAVFSGVERTSKARNFEDSKVTAIFGGVELDMREAVIKKQATLDVFALFGGVELRIPEGWEVQINGFPMFGGFEDTRKGAAPQEGAPILIVNGTVLFGGVSIRS